MANLDLSIDNEGALISKMQLTGRAERENSDHSDYLYVMACYMTPHPAPQFESISITHREM